VHLTIVRRPNAPDRGSALSREDAASRQNRGHLAPVGRGDRADSIHAAVYARQSPVRNPVLDRSRADGGIRKLRGRDDPVLRAREPRDRPVASVHFVPLAQTKPAGGTFCSSGVGFVPLVGARRVGGTKCTLRHTDSIPPPGRVPSLHAEVHAKAAHSRHELRARRRKPTDYETAEKPSSTFAQLTTFHQASM
jgi:hypothetical protein